MQFHQSARMQIGMHVTEHCSVSSAIMKKDMLFVDQKRVFTETGGNGTPLMTEIRTHVFRPRLSVEEKTIAKALDLQSPLEPDGASMQSTIPSSSGQASYTLMPTSALLFRFSALTFNGHRIHYDHDWTRTMEGHPDVVFHGPLSAVALIEMSRRALEPARKLDTFSYRATRPMYTGIPILFESRTDEAGNIESFAQQVSTVGMKAVATAGAATVGP
jgi:3-methylfumaryl-CoA hydratase